MAPPYISELFTPYDQRRCLRSSGKTLLSVPKRWLKTKGAFAVGASRLRNAMPEEIRQNRCHIQNHSSKYTSIKLILIHDSDAFTSVFTLFFTYVFFSFSVCLFHSILFFVVILALLTGTLFYVCTALCDSVFERCFINKVIIIINTVLLKCQGEQAVTTCRNPR